MSDVLVPGWERAVRGTHSCCFSSSSLQSRAVGASEPTRETEAQVSGVAGLSCTDGVEELGLEPQCI